ncbi:MAG: LptF/LptG family permease [Candidatus Zixiibacteriota bacterium]
MIKVIDRYLFKTFIKATLVSLFVFLLVYLIIDNVEHLDDYIDNDATLSMVVRYYLYFFPFIIVQVTPVAVLLGSMFTVGLMARRKEILALNSSGVSMYRIAQPLLLGGLLISAAIYIFSDRIVPEANRRKTQIRYGEIENNPNYGKEQVHNLMYRGSDGRIFRFSNYDPITQTAQQVTIHTVTDNRQESQLDCRRMEWLDSIWIAVDGRLRKFSSESGTEELTEFDTLYLPEIQEPPERFEKSEMIRKGSDQNLGFDLSVADLAKIIEYRRMAAIETTQEEVFLHIKFSLPLASFIIVLLAVPLASDPRRGSVAIGFAFSAGIAFFYILLFEIGQKLGTDGSIPPLLASWGVNGLFLLVGIILMLKARK